MSMYKIVVLGEGAVGKSSLTIRFVQGTFVTEYDPTIENSYRRVMALGDQTILDTAGQEEYIAMRDQYIRAGHGFLLVFSLTSKGSFESMKELHQRIVQVTENERTPMVMLGNKADLKNERQVSESAAKALAAQFKIPYLETSAKTNQTFEAIVRAVMEFRAKAKTGDEEPEANGDPVRRKNGKNKKTPGCTIL